MSIISLCEITKREGYEEGYKQGRADACDEINDYIRELLKQFLSAEAKRELSYVGVKVQHLKETGFVDVAKTVDEEIPFR